jgi:hypothetical protein
MKNIKVLGYYAMQFKGNRCIHFQGKNVGGSMIFRTIGTYIPI